MEGQTKDLVCQFCKKTYSSLSAKNTHMRSFHPKLAVEAKPRTRRIICPLCSECFTKHINLRKHILDFHDINIKVSTLNFLNVDEFECWRTQGGREENYNSGGNKKSAKGVKDLIYNCIRSNARGYESTSTVRQPPAKGSQFINGMCPSRITAKIAATGEVSVEYIETHVGHKDQICYKKLTKAEENKIKDQLTAGVSVDRILQNARIIENNTLKRINVLTKVDLNRIIKTYNINCQRHPNDLTATSLKVEEWNKEGRNHAFLFKNIYEYYEGLEYEDFVVGYMNDIMKNKIKQTNPVICIDGTHGTNKMKYELVTVLIKDENKMGFPIAFLLTNRRDQVIIEIFLKALVMKLGSPINCQYIMTDDEPMFYNAWINIMNAVDKPRRLLCSWHVIKDWNIQGRNKIKSLEIRNAMKSRMSLIMQETNEETFMNLKDSYFKELEGEGEDVFLKYLQSYYFQNKERIMMWAHCYRVNAGINTNVAIESLNKLLKYDELKGHCNIRVEKLLDVLEEIVNEKVWKTIINTERPNFSSYQQRATMQGHKQAEEITYQIELLGCGLFRVKSFTLHDKYYQVSVDEICDEDCRVGYCHNCKICLHRYTCECPENSLKSIICKHIHAVVIFEQASECDAGPTYEDEDYKDFVMDESSSNNFACKEQLIDVMDNHLNDQIENNLGVSNVAKSHETEEEKCTTRVEEVINNSNACARLNPDKRKKYFDDFDQVTARHLMNRRKIELD